MILSAVIVVLAALTGNSHSQDFTTSMDYKSTYVLMDNAGVFYDGPVIQGSITASFENGTYAGIWLSTSPDSGWGEDLGDEIDFFIGWSGDIGDGLKMNAAVFYFLEPEPTFPDIWYPKITISHKFIGWDVGLQAGVYLPVDGSEGGWLVGPTANKTFKVTDKVSIPVTLKFLYDDGGFGGDNGFIPSISTGLTFKATDNLNIQLSVASCTTIGINDARESQLVWGFGASWTF